MSSSIHSHRDIGPIPATTGIGLRAAHYRQILEDRPTIGWLEVHSENYFADGGMPAYFLEQFRSRYPLSVHGVGLSLGSTDPLSVDHLKKLKRLVDRYQPQFVSEHLCWGSVGGRYLNDLLPLPYTTAALEHVVSRIEQVQDFLGRQILIENISSYLQYADSPVPEPEFVVEMAARSGCGVLLDINNLYVNSVNHGFDAREYLRTIPGRLIQEIHLAGHTLNRFEDGEILVDTHNQRVCTEVWSLYDRALNLYGAKPTLIEWDSDLPELDVLLDEMLTANSYMEHSHVRVA